MNAMQLNGMQQEQSADLSSLEAMCPSGDTMMSRLDSMLENVGDFATTIKTANISLESLSFANGIASGNVGSAARSLLGIMDEFLDLQKSSDGSEDLMDDMDFSMGPAPS
jgi:hypothetical protein